MRFQYQHTSYGLPIWNSSASAIWIRSGPHIFETWGHALHGLSGGVLSGKKQIILLSYFLFPPISEKQIIKQTSTLRRRALQVYSFIARSMRLGFDIKRSSPTTCEAIMAWATVLTSNNQKHSTFTWHKPRAVNNFVCSQSSLSNGCSIDTTGYSDRGWTIVSKSHPGISKQ